MNKQANKKKKSAVRSAIHPFGELDIRHSPLPFVIIFLVFSIYQTVGKNDFYLKWAEELSFFAPTSAFFHECMKFPGGLLIYGGTFFTQFFYYPLLGSLLFITLLIAIQHLSVAAFRLPAAHFPLSFIPSVMLLLSITQLGYVWTTLKSPGYFFSNALGVTVCLLCFWGYRTCSKTLFGTLMLTGVIIAGYPLFGFYALFAAFLCLLYEINNYFKDQKLVRFVPVCTVLVLMLLVPRFCYYSVYSYTQDIYIYTAGLPHFLSGTKELVLWIPFIILFISFVLFLFIPFIEKKPKSKFSIFISPILFIAAILFAYTNSYEDENFRAELKMNAAIEQNNWSRAINIARNLRGKPTRNVVLNNNLAVFKLGAENHIMDLKNTVPVNSIRPETALVHLNGRFLFYHYGEINDSYRWCMEDMVEYGRKSSTLKYMVKCAILNEEYELARKYNTLLLNTLFYKEWAKRYQAYIDNPVLAKQDKEMESIRLLMAEKSPGF